MRTIAIAVGALSLLLVALAPTAGAKPKAKVSLKIGSDSQSEVVADSALEVSFKAKRLDSLSITATATPDGGSPVDFASATIGDPPKKETASLPLTVAGEAALADCAALAVEVEASGSAAADTASALLPEDDPECAKPVREFALETSAATPFGIAAGPDGNVWFAEPGAGAVGSLAPDGALDSIHIPVPPTAFEGDPGGHTMIDVAAGPDGAVWALAARGESVRRIDPATGEVTTFPLTTLPFGGQIAAGPDGNLWVSGLSASTLTRVTPSGDTTNFTVSDPSPQPVQLTPYGITAGGDGAVWFTASPPFGGGAAAVGRFDPATGSTQVFRLADPSKRLGDIAADAAGGLWFTTPVGNTIGKVDAATGEITELAIPTADSKPVGIDVADDGSVWFTEASADNIGRFDPASGTFTEYPLETLGSVPFSIAVGADGRVYFGELGVGRIGRLDPSRPPLGAPNPSDGKAMPPYEPRCPPAGFLCQEQASTGGTLTIGDAPAIELPPGTTTITSGVPFPPRGPLPPPTSGPLFESTPIAADLGGTPVEIEIRLAGTPAFMTFFTMLLPVELAVSQPGSSAGACVVGPLNLALNTVNDAEGDSGNPLYTEPILGNNEMAFWTGTLADRVFEVPATSGCGALGDVINTTLGLPSPAGENEMVLPFSRLLVVPGT